MSGKSCAVLDAERDCPSDCQTSRETGISGPVPCLAHTAGGEVTHPKLHSLSLSGPCSIFLSSVPQLPCDSLVVPGPLFCLTGAYLSLSLLYPDACYSPLGLAGLPLWTPSQYLEHTTRAASMEAPMAGPGPREEAYAEWNTQPLYLQLDLLRPRNLTGQ